MPIWAWSLFILIIAYGGRNQDCLHGLPFHGPSEMFRLGQ